MASVYDFGSHNGRHHLVMELIDGHGLAEERRQRTVLDCQEAAATATQILAGLAAAHRQRVIHRDIKPGNIMITADRTVKIATPDHPDLRTPGFSRPGRPRLPGRRPLGHHWSQTAAWRAVANTATAAVVP